MSERRKRLHELLLALINKQDYLELIEDDSNDLANFSGNQPIDFSKSIERNRKILKKYHSLVRTAVTLDALMDSENEENFKINK